ncbi:hypothetical protein GCM10010954_21550 [Halobacillus andaensis]|uniref:Uncharacterized protein n=1 Tax=Halobacillus andaensis TaxID=1176239 RepID=A0A917B527_HALAA|nr:hypothetical protein [Halobacillus andaensis]MBP2004337.1 hypothetical protein [Halobacillus andaensis]GGF22438.1 hypothetical protein GCM10010954_21550 [Halobacillus andaensis]
MSKRKKKYLELIIVFVLFLLVTLLTELPDYLLVTLVTWLLLEISSIEFKHRRKKKSSD